MTKEELDKAKAIAKDPSKTADTVILPVDKGAAVLDSDKEVERSGNRQTREERRREREQAGDVKVPTSDAEAQRAGATIVEAPITFVERRQGASKLSGGVIAESIWMPWRLLSRPSGHRPPS